MHAFCDWVIATCPRLHILINNAAQTIRRPCAYYRGLVEQEMMSIAVPQIIMPTSLMHAQSLHPEEPLAIPNSNPGWPFAVLIS